MRICIVAEGCYPYVVGGVSSWINNLIRSFPQHEFIMLAVISDRSVSGKFKYNLPDNLTEVHEVYLNDTEWVNRTRKNYKNARLSAKNKEALNSLLIGTDTDWETLTRLLQNPKLSLDALLMGPDFLDAVVKSYELKHGEIIFSDFLWTMRSMYLPLFLAMHSDIPKADIFHCVATGYSGVLGSMAKILYPGSRLIVSEHGIYTREREEEVIKASWIAGIYKDLWIDQFKKMSLFAYDKADRVTSLYGTARRLQIELGCPEEKIMITPNGIDQERFKDIPMKEPDDEYINVGAVLRVTPIKDVKTMIMAFGYAKNNNPKLKLWIMGPTDEDEDYAKECFDLVEDMQIKDIIFTGRINTSEYIGKMDFTILTSISEGQPLTILEGYAAHKPAIATDVGNCRGLIYGEDDPYGPSGIVTYIMNVEEIKEAILFLANNPGICKEYGENGYKRLIRRYTIVDMKNTYDGIYTELSENMTD